MHPLTNVPPGRRGYKKAQREARNRVSMIYFIEAVGLDVIKIKRGP